MAMELRGSMVSPLVTGRVQVTGYQKLVQDAEGSEEPGSAHESDAKRHAEKSQAGSVVLENDLKAAIEVKFSGEVSVIYPSDHKFFDTTSEMVMQVSLRDDASISGTCLVFIGLSSLRASESFGSFGIEVAEFLQKEQLEVDRERELQQERKESMNHVIEEEIRAQDKTWCAALPILAFCGLLFSGLLVFCVSVEPQDWASALMLSLAVTLMFYCMFGCCAGTFVGLQHLASQAASHFATARFLAELGPLVWIFLGFLCLAAAAVRYIHAGFWWSALMPGLICYCASTFTCLGEDPAILRIGRDPPIASVFKRNAAERTIVFRGSVLEGGGPCVASWPGKYESAWDSLVQGSRRGYVSAAVVFLPEGSEHFGHHDPIPLAEGLEGSCWCVPLYGVEVPVVDKMDGKHRESCC